MTISPLLLGLAFVYLTIVWLTWFWLSEVDQVWPEDPIDAWFLALMAAVWVVPLSMFAYVLWQRRERRAR